jgi:hypothetical protein
MITAGAAAQGGDVMVNHDGPGLVPNAHSLTLITGHPDIMVMAYNDHPYAFGPGLGISLTQNGGITWSDQQLAYPATASAMFDPVVVADGQGFVYANCISTDLTGWSGLFLYRSDNQGVSWPTSGLQIELNSFPRLTSKPHAAVNRNPGSPYEDDLYFAWVVDASTAPFSDIRAARVKDSGTDILNVGQISDLPTNAGMGRGPSVAVAIDDTVYVAWIDYDVTSVQQELGDFMLDRSTDGGATWGDDTFVRQIITVPTRLSDFVVPRTDTSAYSYPCLATSPQDADVLYMAYAADPDEADMDDEADVYCMHSTDGGDNWSAPRQLNLGSMGHEFEPRIAVKPDGTIDVVWYESPFIDGGGCLWDVMFARSVDGGFTFSTPVVVTDNPFVTPVDPGSLRWMGDYVALAVDETNAFIGFTSTGDDIQGDVFGDVYFDRVSNDDIEPSLAGDVDHSGSIGIGDLLSILSAWGDCGICFEDLNLDGKVDIIDVLTAFSNWSF